MRIRTTYSRCINRNIVECKENPFDGLGTGRRRINRNIVECKDSLTIMGRKDFYMY